MATDDRRCWLVGEERAMQTAMDGAKTSASNRVTARGR
jgi:hypothetical protein